MKSRGFIFLIALLLWIGAFARLAPLMDEQGMLYSISEDGYLMMTIARNMAIGLGMTTAEGTLPTNGTQPLVTFLWAGAYWLEGGDKVNTLVWIILIQFLIATLAAFLLWRLGLQILQPHPLHQKIAALAAATWYVSPVASAHTMNGLETGLYGLAILWVVIMLFSTKAKQWSLGYSVLLGLALGITFLIRNDAALLILAVCLMYLLIGGSRREIFQRFWQVNVMGLTSVLVALPWLIYNQLNFGSIMPISGQSQSLTAEFGQNLLSLPPVLIEYFFVFLPIPHSLQNRLPIILVCTVLLLGIIIMISRLVLHLTEQQRSLFMLMGLYLLGLCAFYGLYFGASYFIPRYFFPLSPFLALLWAAIIVWAWQKMPWQQVRYGFALLFLIVIIGLSMRSYLKGNQHQHFQVVDWVQQHVAEHEWVGAIQSGTLGYFHDRTINLDGKVNPDALEARKRQQVIEYVIEKRIDYIADWVGIATWMDKHALIRQHFDVVVKDHQRNLAVLKRHAD